MFMNDIEPEGEPIPRLTLSLQDVTLFQAVTAVAQEMGFSVCVSSFGLDIHCVHREFPGWKISVRCIKPAKEELSDFDRRIVESTFSQPVSLHSQNGRDQNARCAALSLTS